MSTTEHPDVTLARAVATGVHQGQLDEDGTPVMDVLARTAELLTDFADPVKTSAAWLRLVLRESQVGTGDLAVWGVRASVRELLVLLTPRVSEDENGHLARLLADRDASLVELSARLAASPGPRDLTRQEQALARAGGVWSRIVLHRAGL